MKKIKIECDSCGGTGLYQGMAEGGKSAVVCHYCGGTGYEEIKAIKIGKNFIFPTRTDGSRIKEFKKRKLRKNVERVFGNSCGYGHTHEDVTNKEGKLIQFSKAGCSYKDWLNGIKPLPVKDLYCPYLWTGQHLQSEDVGGLYKTRCDKDGLSGCGLISTCRLWEDKAKCWELYEKGGGK